MNIKSVLFAVATFKLLFALSMIITCPIWFAAKLLFDYDISDVATDFFKVVDQTVNHIYPPKP